jgi:hypothetical protein
MANQEGGIGQAIFTGYDCNFVLPLSAQSTSSKNRVGALLAGVVKSSPVIGAAEVLDVNAAHECVNPQAPLWQQLQAADFSYRADTEAQLQATLSISSFNLSGLQWKYINEIIVNITNATVSQAPDDYIGEAVAYWKSNPFYKTRDYTDVVVTNCAGIVDLKFYFDASLDLGKINFTVGKLTVALGASLQIEQGQEADNTTNPPTQRSYVRFSSTGSPATATTPASPAFPVVFGLVLANPADYE